MKQISNIILLAVCTATLLCSCNKAKSIYVSEEILRFAIDGGEKSVTVTADGSFDIADCPEWLNAESNDSTVIFTADENKTGAVRDAIVNLVGNNVTIPITILQADKCTFIAVSETEVTIPKEGGTKELTIESDGAKIIAEASEGINSTINGNNLSITAPANEGSTKNGTITLACDTVTTILKVIIEGSICGHCGGKGTITCSKCGGRGWYSQGDGALGCSKCGGSGDVSYMLNIPYGNGHVGSGKVKCPECGGSGK